MKCYVLIFGLLTATVESTSVQADELSQTVQSAIAAVAPSVLRIRTIGIPDEENLSVSSQITTGLAISDRGDVLTSAFGFSSDPTAIFVEDAQGKRVAAKIVAKDHVRKLVLLKCEYGDFRVPPLAKEHWPDVGAWAIALGKLFPGDQPAVSVGVISAVTRVHGLAIQTDAKISPVNYGGPLVDLHGQVTGILVPLSPSDSGDEIRAGVEWYDSGIGFAIPIADALQVAEKLRSGKDRLRGVMGIRPSTRNPLANEFKIAFVFPKSPAEEAGLKKGDRIVAVDGKTMNRFGTFDSIVKSSYAGEELSLTVLREEQTLDVSMRLVEKLESPKHGFVGLLVGTPTGAADSEEFGIQAYAFPDSPAAKCGIPESAVLTMWGDLKLKSADELQNQLRTDIANTDVKVTFRENTTGAEPQQATLTSAERPNQIMSPTEAILNVIADGSEEMQWNRNEEKFGEDGKVWFYAPDATPGHTSGMLILLSESESPQEAVLNRWDKVCRKYNLMLVVLSNAEGTALTREDAQLLPLALASALPGRGIEVSRSVLIAKEDQKELCSDLLLNPRLRQVRAAAYIECWPGVSGISSQVLAVKSPSVLLLDGTIESRQRRALREQSVRQLIDAGAWVIQDSASDVEGVTPEERIALWTINLKAR